MLNFFNELFLLCETNDDGLVCIADLVSGLPVCGVGDEAKLRQGRKATRGVTVAGCEGPSEGMLQHVVMTGTAIQQPEPDTMRYPVKLNHFLHVFVYVD